MSREWRAAVAAGVLGIEGSMVAIVGFAPFEARQAWFAALAVWITGACGLLAWLRAPGSRSGPLLVLAAVAWGVASAMSVDPQSPEPGQRTLALGWAAIAAHAILSFPIGLPTFPRGARLLVLVGYLATALPSPLGPAVLAAVIAGGIYFAWASLARRERPYVVVAGLALGAGLIAAAGLLPIGAPIDPRLASEVALVVTALVLSTALVRGAERPRRVEDVLLELGPGGGDALTVRLASILDDPTLRMGYWIEDLGRYVSPAGRPMTAAAGGGRVATEIGREGRNVALLEHAPGRVSDHGVIDAIGRAADLSVTNARLQADVERQSAEVDASRRRLAVAAEAERRSFTRRLEDVLDPRLAELESELEGIITDSPESEADRPLAQVRDVRRDMATLVRGWAPKAMNRGLAVAITELAAGLPIPATVHATTHISAAGASEEALYFVCSEALANVLKHAAAAAVDIRLERSGRSVELEIRDDGVGGADAVNGAGLRGLRDRVEALGGTLSVLSPSGRGTLVRVVVPSQPVVSRQDEPGQPLATAN